MLHKTKNMLIAGLSAIIIFSTQVQAVTPSPQMIEQFKQLPKSEQARIAQQYGIDPSSFGGSSTNTRVENPQVVSERVVNGANAQTQNANTELDFKQDNQRNELNRFGYDMFAGEPTTFAPVSDVPVPSEYMVGPGDTINVQLYGKENQQYSLTIGRNGSIQFPSLGPIQLHGMSFSEVRDSISEKIKQQMIGIESNISMGELRSIRIFVAGDAYKPGSYTVSSLSTITQALFVAGGVNEIGSLRNVQLKRNGRLVGKFDLYDLLLRGDASGDINLRSGDVVFIPAVGGLVSVTGEVRRPAIYEIAPNETIADVVTMAAGVKAAAYPKATSLERYNSNGLKSIINLDLTSAKDKTLLAKSGDYIRVKNASSQFENTITLAGAVVRPGKFQWRDGIKVADILPSLWGDLAPTADLNYALVIREINKYGDIEVLQFSLGAAIAEGSLADNLPLLPRDKILVFNYDDSTQNRFELNKLIKQRIARVSELNGDSLLGNDLFQAGFESLDFNGNKKISSRDIAGVVISDTEQLKEQKAVSNEVSQMLGNLFDDIELIKVSNAMSRGELLYPIISKLYQQGSTHSNVKVIAAAGKVRHPGLYPLSDNATVSDLITAAGGLTEGAYIEKAELTRTSLDDSGSGITHIRVDISSALMGDQSADIALQSRDALTIQTIPDWQESKSIELRGEVKFPGVYNIGRGETLAKVLERAGGFTQYAAPNASVFVRESVRQQEELEIKKLANQLRRDIASRGISKDGIQVNYADAQMMLTDLENIKAVGRLVVDLNAISLGIDEADLQLENADVLYIPSIKQTIAVMGEVQHPSTHRFKTGYTLEQYLSLSGGPRERADEDRTYIIKADGSVVLPNQSAWFASGTEMSAGDTVIVPLDTEYKDNLTLWTQVTGIIYNTAVAISAISGL
ncbi:SLBB domain-containing protein [Shewanella litoralis]|uniref:Sugar transporter n=1 Tax=Shewanella litoralis TaxID=2282700 RepID=A0ABQ2R5T9_9GAMM|nr:SLBB domain-containing protein [Shewanella litoralis]GGQ09569.1 sugar transporter [Shewanella litoralis]